MRPLTEKQFQVVQRICYTNKVIARELGTTDTAVRMVFKRLFDRTGVDNRTALLVKLLRDGVVRLEDIRW